MPANHSPHTPRQERSRRTLSRLLAATIWMLDEYGLEGATIPHIARMAEVAPATVYRRFKNKQALLRAAFLHMLERSNEANREHLANMLAHGSLERAARKLIDLMFMQLRKHPGLMQALEQFLENDDDPAFVEAAQALLADNLDQVIEAMLAHRMEILHPDPEHALRIATLMANASIGAMAFKPRSQWSTLQPTTDEALAQTFAGAFVAYLKSGA